MTRTIQISGANALLGNTKLILLIAMLGGFFPITAIAASVLGFAPLQTSAIFCVLPAYLVILLAGISDPKAGKVILTSWLFGIIAVTIYDFSRIPFMIAGWNDFIPKIGDWVLGTEGAHWSVGYGWRYAGNGGGMGIVFGALVTLFKPRMNLKVLGLIYGLFIYSCLMLLLVFSNQGQNLMFELTPLNVIGSAIGHIIYGLVLGTLIHRLHKRAKKDPLPVETEGHMFI